MDEIADVTKQRVPPAMPIDESNKYYKNFKKRMHQSRPASNSQLLSS